MQLESEWPGRRRSGLVALLVGACIAGLMTGVPAKGALAEEMEGSGSGTSPGYAGIYEAKLSAVPVNIVVRRPFLLDPVANPAAFPAHARVTSIGDREASASLVGLGSVETAGGLAPLLLPRNSDDVIDLLQAAPGLAGVPLPPLEVPRPATVPVPQLPLPNVPPTPNTVYSFYPNSPEAEAGFGSLPPNRVIGGEVVKARASSTADGARAVASGQNLTTWILGPTGSVSVGSALAHSELKVLPDGIVGRSETRLGDLRILDLISIGELVSGSQVLAGPAGARSLNAVTVVGAMVSGIPVVIGKDGVAVDGERLAPGLDPATATDTVRKVLDERGVELRLLSGGEGAAPADGESVAQSEASGLSVKFSITPDRAVPAVGGSTNEILVFLGWSAGSAMVGAPPEGFDFVDGGVGSEAKSVASDPAVTAGRSDEFTFEGNGSPSDFGFGAPPGEGTVAEFQKELGVDDSLGSRAPGSGDGPDGLIATAQGPSGSAAGKAGAGIPRNSQGGSGPQDERPGMAAASATPTAVPLRGAPLGRLGLWSLGGWVVVLAALLGSAVLPGRYARRVKT